MDATRTPATMDATRTSSESLSRLASPHPVYARFGPGVRRSAAMLAATLLCASAWHCGAGAGQAAPATASAAADSPAAKCLAIADAKRERNPKEPLKIGVKHVLVQYRGAKRAPASATRTREQACLRALEARDALRAGTDFAEIVKKYSDEAGAATREGSLGSVERAELAPPFADAAFELHANEFSDVVESDFGFHLIMRTQ